MLFACGLQLIFASLYMQTHEKKTCLKIVLQIIMFFFLLLKIIIFMAAAKKKVKVL